MADKQQGQSNQGSSGQASNKGEAKPKSAPSTPKATPPEQRTNIYNDAADR